MYSAACVFMGVVGNVKFTLFPDSLVGLVEHTDLHLFGEEDKHRTRVRSQPWTIDSQGKQTKLHFDKFLGASVESSPGDPDPLSAQRLQFEIHRPRPLHRGPHHAPHLRVLQLRRGGRGGVGPEPRGLPSLLERAPERLDVRGPEELRALIGRDRGPREHLSLELDPDGGAEPPQHRLCKHSCVLVAVYWTVWCVFGKSATHTLQMRQVSWGNWRCKCLFSKCHWIHCCGEQKCTTCPNHVQSDALNSPGSFCISSASMTSGL